MAVTKDQVEKTAKAAQKKAMDAGQAVGEAAKTAAAKAREGIVAFGTTDVYKRQVHARYFFAPLARRFKRKARDALHLIIVVIHQVGGIGDVVAAALAEIHVSGQFAQDQNIEARTHDFILQRTSVPKLSLIHIYKGYVTDEEVLSAVKWHTTGRAGMTMLEKIVYLADYIEPSRDFDGVEKLRRLAFENIDKAVLYGLQTSIEHIIENKSLIDTDSVGAYNYYRKLFPGEDI